MCCDYSGGSTLFVVTQFPFRKYVVAQVIYCLASAVLIIPIVLLNGISVFTIWKSSHLKAKLCYFLIVILSIFDLAVGVISVPANIALAALELRGIASCVDAVILEAIVFVPPGISMTITCLLTLERYLAILHPIFHRSHLTKRRVLICVCCLSVWFVITGPVIRIFSESLQTMANAATLFVVLAFNTFAYIRIYFAVKNMHFSNDEIGDCSTEREFKNER